VLELAKFNVIVIMVIVGAVGLIKVSLGDYRLNVLGCVKNEGFCS